MRKPWRAFGLIFLAAVVVLPVWCVKYPPLLDYPNHLASSYVLAHLHDPSLPFHEWYAAKWGLYPYLALEVSLRVLQALMNVEVAGRIYLTLALLALPLSMWFFLGQANPGQDAVALWALVATHNIFFLLSYSNFYVSLSFCFLSLGLWLKWLRRPRATFWLATLLSVTALYFSHLVAFAFTGIAVTAYWLAMKLWRGSRDPEVSTRNANSPLRSLVLTWTLFMPGALFYLVSARVIEKQSAAFFFLSFEDKLDSLRNLMHGYSERLDYITIALFAAWFLLAWIANREFRWSPRWLAVAVVLFGVYWAMPWAYGDGSDLDIRVLPIFFGVMLAVVAPGRRGWLLAPVVLVLFLLRVGNVVENYRAAQPELKGLAASFQVTEYNARVLPIVRADPDSGPLDHPFAHFWSYGVIRKHWFSPYLFELQGLTPLRITHDSYTLDGFWVLTYKETPDWSAMQEDYDYVWSYNCAQYDAGLSSIGSLVYSDRKLRMYRMRKQ